MASVPLPQFTDSVDNRYFIEPLDAPTAPRNSLDRFPNAVYGKYPDSHLVRFLYALLGPVGVGWLKLNLTLARLALEAAGADLFDLDAAYGNPFSLARIASESYDSDLSGLLPASVWNQIRIQDASYRSRAILFLKAASQGTTPLGMQLAASSGLGQNVDIIENYVSLFDHHSDDPLGLPYVGRSFALGEFIVIPRPAISLSEQQILDFGATTIPLGVNHYTLAFNGDRVTLDPAILGPGGGQTAADVQTALWQLRTIGAGNVIVTGGPVPAQLTVTFTGTLSNQAVAPLKASFVVDNQEIVIPVTVITGAVDPNIETVTLGAAAQHDMQVALDYLRPVASFPTFSPSRSSLHAQSWASVTASSQFSQVSRFVTGTPNIAWPPVDSTHWIVASEELQAPQLHNDIQQHYVGFHNVASVTSYTDLALLDPSYATTTAILPLYASVHIGAFPEMASVMPYFNQFTDPSFVFGPRRALADYTEPLTVSSQTADGVAYVNNIYPADYTRLQGVPQFRYTDADLWASAERASGADILEIDLGSPQAVNYLAFQITRKPLSIEVAYDLLDQSPGRRFVPVTPISTLPFTDQLFFDPSQQNPWEYLELYFNDGIGMIYTRFIRLKFTRRADSTSYGRFLFDTVTQTQTPWSIEVHNLRLGRNVPPSVN